MKKINDLYTLSTPLNLPASRKVNLDLAAQESIYYFDWNLILPDLQSTGKKELVVTKNWTQATPSHFRLIEACQQPKGLC